MVSHPEFIVLSPEYRLVAGVIKQALDDYNYPSTSRIQDPYKLNAIRKKAESARRFLFGKDFERLSKAVGFDRYAKTWYLRRLIASDQERAYNFRGRAGCQDE